MTVASEDVARTELHADPRADRAVRLRYGVLPRALAGPAHHDQVAVPERVADLGVPADRTQLQLAWGSERHDRDHGVVRPTAADPIAVPRDRVVAVPVVAATRGHEGLSELRLVMVAQGVAGLIQCGMGELLTRAVIVQQSRHVDNVVVHRSPLGAPRDALDQIGEQLVGALEPAGEHVDPRAGGQLGAPYAIGDRTDADVLDTVEAGVEERGLEPDGHMTEPSTRSNTCASASYGKLRRHTWPQDATPQRARGC